MRSRFTRQVYLPLLLGLIALCCAPSPQAVHPIPGGNQVPATASTPTTQIKSTPTPEDAASTESYKVKRVVDGDTVIILIEGKETRVRLIGVDTPETVHPQKAVQAYGKEASQFTKNLLEGESVYLEYEAGSSRLDKYGRTLAYLYRAPDRLFVNLEIIRQGYGHAYTKYPFQHMETFRSQERAAQEAGRGLWGQGATILSDAGPAAPVGREAGIGPKKGMASADSQTPQEATPQPSEQTKSVTVYVTRTGAKYHLDGCRYLSRSQIPMSLKAAKQSYTPCSVCRPPQ